MPLYPYSDVNQYAGVFPRPFSSHTTTESTLAGVSNSGPDRAYAYYSEASSNYDGVLWPSEEESFQVSPFSARGPVGRFTAKPVGISGFVCKKEFGSYACSNSKRHI